MQKKSVNYYIGIAFIALGVLFLIGSITGSNNFWAIFWPVFILLPGLFFVWLWQSIKDTKGSWGLLIPGTILVVLSVGFFFNSLITELLNYSTIWAWTSFMYTGSVAAAFWVVWTVTGNEGFKTVARIMGIISLAIFIIVGASLVLFEILPGEKFWPIILIVLGLLIIFGQGILASFYKKGRFFGKTEEEWRSWGENLGKQIEEEDRKDK